MQQSRNGQIAPMGQGCPACNCFVYHADQVNRKILIKFNKKRKKLDNYFRYSPKAGCGTSNVSNVVVVPDS